MLYEIQIHKYIPRDVVSKYQFDNPMDAHFKLSALTDKINRNTVVAVTKNGQEITLAELSADFQRYVPPDSDPVMSELKDLIDAQTRLRPGYRAGRTGGADIAMDANGDTRSVHVPRNPEDRFA